MECCNSSGDGCDQSGPHAMKIGDRIVNTENGEHGVVLSITSRNLPWHEGGVPFVGTGYWYSWVPEADYVPMTYEEAIRGLSRARVRAIIEHVAAWRESAEYWRSVTESECV